MGRRKQGSHCQRKAQRKNVGNGKAAQAPGQGISVLQELEDKWEKLTKTLSAADLGSNEQTSQPGLRTDMHFQMDEQNSYSLRAF